MSAPAKEVPTVDINYWNKKWVDEQIAFHRSDIHELLKSNMDIVCSKENKMKFLFPLCGKTLDMKHMLDKGHEVFGIEGSKVGIEAFLSEHNLTYSITDDGNYKVYRANELPITFYHGDFFLFDRLLPEIDVIWDRGGLVAVNIADREKYRDVLIRLMTPTTKLFVVAMFYDDEEIVGPPMCLTDEQVQQLFAPKCTIKLITALDCTEDFSTRHKKPVKRMEERLHLIQLK
ncbi:unnamed protein product [Didymodactylos carnosus]|uniref:thiopurine S-methyltransferase n=1 Tax=Didymodactylos carnosus TaxID=1234261 RepID=A0A813Y0S9_9BILA|nr:unnamed protein product [Didymodactylos carnosus]CAF0875041.1 unnamed protein product [Didymodactylos carnosus]CAF3546999.1 unnamed protein product [Didymodactylos carnosus]CAF3661971.1 unnamed protein product [Didymodactylos carnosus]